MDLVPNHTSSQHPWFQAALAAGPGSAERERYIFRDGRGPRRRRAAEQLAVGLRRAGLDPGDRTGRHPRPVVPAPVRRRAAGPQLGQPGGRSTTSRRRCGSGWTAVSTGSASTSRTAWPSPPGLPDMEVAENEMLHARRRRPAVRPRRACMRSTAASGRCSTSTRGAVAVGEVWVYDNERFAAVSAARRTAPRLQLPAGARRLRRGRDAGRDRQLPGRGCRWQAPPRPGRCPTTTSSRDVTRYGGGEIGLRRARAMVLVKLALPGAVFVYNGDELGLPERRPAGRGAAGPDVGAVRAHRARPRRVPGADAVVGRRAAVRVLRRPDTWLPMPPEWAPLTVERQLADPDSTLNFFRRALDVRRGLAGQRLEWVDAPMGALVFRVDGLVCSLNAGEKPIEIPSGELLLASGPLVDGRLPPDTAAWLVERPT